MYVYIHIYIYMASHIQTYTYTYTYTYTDGKHQKSVARSGILALQGSRDIFIPQLWPFFYSTANKQNLTLYPGHSKPLIAG